jgi:hypothetical protein
LLGIDVLIGVEKKPASSRDGPNKERNKDTREGKDKHTPITMNDLQIDGQNQVCKVLDAIQFAENLPLDCNSVTHTEIIRNLRKDGKGVPGVGHHGPSSNLSGVTLSLQA